MSIEQSSMSGGTRGRSFTGLFAPPKCAASGRVIQAGCQLWIIKIIGSPTRPCSGWPLPFTAHSPRGSAWCSTSRKAETMLGRSFSGKTARGPRRRGACGKGRRSTCPRFLACYSNTNKDCIERYGRGEVKRRFSTQPRRVGTLRGDPRPAARCGERDVFRSNDDEYKQARLLSKSHHHYSPSQVKVYSSRRQKSHMQRQWARLARRGWCAGVVPTAPRSLERIRREMRQAEPPARGGAAQASLGL